MKKNIYITIFLILTLSVFIPINVKANTIINGISVSDDFYFPRYEDIVCPPYETNCSDTLLGKILSSYNSDYHLQCWYSITNWSGSNIPNNDTHSEIYCYVSSDIFVPYLHWQNGQYTNQYNPDGFTIDGYPWINSGNHNSYQSLAIYRWNYVNYTWDTICANWSNSCIYNVIGNNQYPIVNYSSISNDTSTPIFKTDIWYTSNRWNAPLFQGNLRPRSNSQVELIITESNSDSQKYVEDYINVTLYDPDSELIGGKVQYSYDNTNWIDTDISDNGSIYTFRVYTNGTIYFRAIDSNNTVLYSTTYQVTNLPTITGYQLYTIPGGNYNIYISNFSNTTGTIYIPPGYGSFTDSFIYLDSTGNITGTQDITYVSYQDNVWIPAYTMSEPSSTLYSIDYDFTNYNNTKVLAFNYNNEDSLVLYIPNGLYLDYVSVSDKDNYNCGSDTNLSGTIKMHTCYVKYKYKDNDTIINQTDKSNNRLDLSTPQESDNSSQDYFSRIKRVLEYNTPIILGATQDFTTFFNTLSTPIKMSFFFCFGVVFIVLICKSFKF